MASKRRQRRRQCESKVRHETEEKAWAAVRYNPNPHADGKCEPYHCNNCGGWHVGHPVGSYRKSFSKYEARMSQRTPRASVR